MGSAAGSLWKSWNAGQMTTETPGDIDSMWTSGSLTNVTKGTALLSATITCEWSVAVVSVYAAADASSASAGKSLHQVFSVTVTGASTTWFSNMYVLDRTEIYGIWKLNGGPAVGVYSNNFRLNAAYLQTNQSAALQSTYSVCIYMYAHFFK